MTTIHCARCGHEGERQAFKPFQNDLGQRIYDTVCKSCWADWLKAQQQLINHYALVPHQPGVDQPGAGPPGAEALAEEDLGEFHAGQRVGGQALPGRPMAGPAMPVMGAGGGRGMARW